MPSFLQLEQKNQTFVESATGLEVIIEECVGTPTLIMIKKSVKPDKIPLRDLAIERREGKVLQANGFYQVSQDCAGKDRYIFVQYVTYSRSNPSMMG